MTKEKYYIYHYCLNENLKDGHPDKCNNCFIDVAHGGANAYSPQNWKYCPDCVAKGYKQPKSYSEGRKIREELITDATGYKFKGRTMSNEHKEKLVLSRKRKSETMKKM